MHRYWVTEDGWSSEGDVGAFPCDLAGDVGDTSQRRAAVVEDRRRRAEILRRRLVVPELEWCAWLGFLEDGRQRGEDKVGSNSRVDELGSAGLDGV